MKKILWIQTMAVAGVLLLASCAQSHDGGAVESGDQSRFIQGVRAPGDVLTMLESYTGVSINNGPVRTTYDLVKNQLPWNGNIDPNSAKAVKELVAIHCQQANTSTPLRRRLFGNWNPSANPRGGNGGLNSTEADRTAVVNSLYLKATGNKPSAEELNILLTGFNELLLATPTNDSAGNIKAMDAICTAIGSSAMSSLAF